MKAILTLLALCCSGLATELRDIPYTKDPHPLQKLDLYLPTTTSPSPRPVVIAIHGGGWSIGDKTNKGFVKPKIPWLNSQGFVVASINYRLSPAVRHPAHIEDVCASIAWIQKNIASHGGDPRQIYLLGHSAGAHLAALAAVDQARLKKAKVDPSSFRGVILLDGAGYDVALQMRTGTKYAQLRGMYVNAFTLDPDTQRDASPAFKITKQAPPFLILHVTRRRDSAQQSRILAEAVKKSGGWASVIAVPGKNHSSISQDLGKPWDPTTTAVSAFLSLKEPKASR